MTDMPAERLVDRLVADKADPATGGDQERLADTVSQIG